MRVSKRIKTSAVYGVLAFGAVPLVSAYAIFAQNDRYLKQEKLRSALHEAAGHYNQRTNWGSIQHRSQQQLEEAESRLPRITRHKKVIRDELVTVREQLADIAEQYHIDPENEAFLEHSTDTGKNALAEYLQYLYFGSFIASTSDANAWLRNLAQSPLQDWVHDRSALQARTKILRTLQNAHRLQQRERELTAKHEALLAEYHDVTSLHASAGGQLEASAEQQAAAKREYEAVQREIAKMQKELARIDAKMRRKTERVLLEKGLLPSRKGEYGKGYLVDDETKLNWPAYGRISAGFLQASYERYFGVPHKAIDIAIPQGTPIKSAADGIVYKVRDGGQYGYSYILIGHANMMITVYGHMFKMDVVPGQEVRAGEIIGLSGGMPGTWGAGRMTTGPHLHFEVIQKGQHIDPMTVLP